VLVDREGRAETVAAIARAGVPSLLRRKDGTWLAAFQWFPEGAARPRPPDAPEGPAGPMPEIDPVRRYDAIAVARSSDGGRTWTKPRTIGLRGLPERERFPFDPTLVELEDGRVRLYMTRNEFGPWGPGEPFIGSAVSADGQDFDLEEGVRFAVEGQVTIDAACAFFRGAWHLFVPCQDRPWLAFHAVSRDGLRFERLAEVEAPEGHRWLGCAVPDGAGLWFYGTGPGGVWEGVSADGAAWTVTRLLAARAADPGVLRHADGTLALLGVGPPRPGTPSARRMPRPPEPR
jgi:hypothetical protein